MQHIHKMLKMPAVNMKYKHTKTYKHIHNIRFTLESFSRKRKKNCLYSQTHRATKVHMLSAPLKVNTAV